MANVILKKVWVKLIIMRQQLLADEENQRKQSARQQQRTFSNLAMSAKEQMDQHVDSTLEQKLDIDLAIK